MDHGWGKEWRNHGEIKLCLALLCGLPGAGKTSLAVSLNEMGLPLMALPAASLDETEGERTTVLHLCYDDIIPTQLEMDVMKRDSSFIEHIKQSSTSPWKTYRQEIVHCMDCILKRLKSNKTSNIATVFSDVKCLLSHQERSQIGREVWSKILWLFQGQLKVTSSKHHELLSHSSSQVSYDILTPSVVLIIDDNMYYRSMRYDYYQLARKYGTGFCQLYLHCSTEVAVARNSERCRDIPMETIVKMAGKIEAPDQEVASWEKHCIRINAEQMKNENTMSEVWDLISTALLNPVSPLDVENTEEKEACRTVCAASTIHQADQSLRKCVAKAMAAAKDEGLLTKAELRALGSKLNATRQDILQGVRDCKVHPPPLVTMETDHSNSKERCSDFDAFIQGLFEKEQQAS